jgi:hypothetical protein
LNGCKILNQMKSRKKGTKQFEQKIKRLIYLLILLYVGQGVVKGMFSERTVTFYNTAQAEEAETIELPNPCALEVVECSGERMSETSHDGVSLASGNKGQLSPQKLNADGTGAKTDNEEANISGMASASSIETLKKVAKEEGVDWKLLQAICLTESNCHSDRVGDGGTSYGAFQIHLPVHSNISKNQAFDFEWSARWTARHGKQFADNPPMFCKAHNGIAKTTNQWYIDRCMSFYNSL